MRDYFKKIYIWSLVQLKCLTKAGVANLYAKLLVLMANIIQDHICKWEDVGFVCPDCEDSCVPLIVLALMEKKTNKKM